MTDCRLLLLFCVITLAGGCTYVVNPPGNPREPESVYLLDHGRHASLALPSGGYLVRYAYGDWMWYALVRKGPVQGSRALLGPSPAGLGRGILEAEDITSLRESLVVSVEEAWSIPVESRQIEQLVKRLDGFFLENEKKTYNPKYDLVFVRHPAPYTWSHNSNAVVAKWLEELGCEVQGGGLLSRWKIVP